MAERCLLVLPTYNQAALLTGLVEENLLVGDLLGEPALNVLIIDDHSSDGTGSLAEVLKRDHQGRVQVLHRLEKLGAASAYTIGFRYALASGYQYLVQMGADRAHDPSSLPSLLRAARKADLVLASRYAGAGEAGIEQAWRALAGKLAKSYSALTLGLPISDPASAYRCFRREALEALDLRELKTQGAIWQIEVTYRCAQLGLRVVEVPLSARPSRQLRVPGGTVWEALRLLWELRLADLPHGRPLAGVPVDHGHHNHGRRRA